MANIVFLLSVISIILTVFFVKNSVSVTGNCSTKAGYIDSLESLVMSEWQMRILLAKQNNDYVEFYCGFYCNGTCNSYLFSVVAVGGSNHSVVWTANGDHPVKGNASVQLTRGGLVLQDSDGKEVWSSNTSGNSTAGLKLNETGNLILFNNQNTTLWESPASKVSFNRSNSTGSGENTPEFLPPASGPLPDVGPNIPEPPPPKRHQIRLAAIISGSIAGAFVVIAVLLILIARVKSKRTKEEEDVEIYIKQVPGMPVRFSHDDLRLATMDFKERLGGGGFGSVFKGVLADGTAVAIKRLDKLGQGVREFLAEVETIGSLHHFNLVRLIGFCEEKSSRLLVYEYMSNGSLDNWIFNKDLGPCLDWQTRKKIILDIAKGLAYLHEDCRQTIIHLDIKPQNILLDENFNAKVSDFGLSKLINRDESQVLTTMRGTPGYLAPEWRQLRITVKVDIYSFGIVLLEVASRRRNLDHSRSESTLHLLQVLQKKAEEDRLIDVVENFDEDMQNHGEEVVRMIRIGAWCLQDDPSKRPPMSTVVKVLEGVMEVDPNIIYKFSHVLAPTPVVNDHISPAPPASVLSNPR